MREEIKNNCFQSCRRLRRSFKPLSFFNSTSSFFVLFSLSSNSISGLFLLLSCCLSLLGMRKMTAISAYTIDWHTKRQTKENVKKRLTWNRATSSNDMIETESTLASTQRNNLRGLITKTWFFPSMFSNSGRGERAITLLPCF